MFLKHFNFLLDLSVQIWMRGAEKEGPLRIWVADCQKTPVLTPRIWYSSYYYSPSPKSTRLTHYPPQRYANLSCYPFTDCCVKEWAKKTIKWHFLKILHPFNPFCTTLDWFARGSKENKDKQSFHQWRSCGPMDKASDYESGDCRFEACQGQHFLTAHGTRQK